MAWSALKFAALPTLVVFGSAVFANLSHAQVRTAPASVVASGDYGTVISGFTLDDIRAATAGIWVHGLNPSAYWTPEMESAFTNGSPSLRATANAKFLQLLKDLSIGSVNPEELTEDIKVKRKNFVTPQQLQTLAITAGMRADILVENIAPKNAPYLALKPGIKKLYSACGDGSYSNLLLPKKTLKNGVKDPAVVGVKKRLALWGYPISNFNDVVDAQVVAAINDIEWNLHMKPDGAMSPGGTVWKFINASCKSRLRQLQADMEKMRWFPQTFEDRFIFLNLAMNYFVMFDRADNFMMTFRTINGRPTRKTPTMRDKVARVILNPQWIVPPTIFIEDKVEEIKTLPRNQIREYFASHNYEIWDLALKKRYDPASVDWWNLNSKEDANFYIRQKPNYSNALGIAKFELTNPYMIYLHDTNQRELFASPNRLISSGCIRLEKPLDVAEFLLKGTEWDAAKIQSTVAAPGEVLDNYTAIPLKNAMPVYMVFLTSQASSDGIVRFTDDVYGQNDLILSKMNGVF